MLTWIVGLAMGQQPAELVAHPERDEIIGGDLVAPGEYEEVVAILVFGSVVCSGTRVAPGLVLTAGHCIPSFADPSDVFVSTGLDALQGPREPAIAFGVHPDFCRDCDEDVFDYAFVQVEAGSLGIDAVAVPIFDQSEWDQAVARGADVTIVGYGRDPGTGAAARIKRKVTVALGKSSASGQEFAAGGKFRDSCEGDSGGPVFVELADGARRQIGITSRGSEPCGNGGVYATPYPALRWLREQTGVDLCGPGCSTCDCLDITPPPPESGCGCSTRTPPPPGSIALALWLVTSPIRRRRGRDTSPVSASRSAAGSCGP